MTLPSKESSTPPRESQDYIWVNDTLKTEYSSQIIPNSTMQTESSSQNISQSDLVSPSGTWDHPTVYDDFLIDSSLSIPEFPTLSEVLLPWSPEESDRRPRFLQLRPRPTLDAISVDVFPSARLDMNKE